MIAPPHYRNGKYFNPGAQPHGFGDLFRWLVHRERGAWRPWIASEPGPMPVERVDGERLRLTFVNHATVLIQTGGLNILTDPIWSLRASPLSWTGPKRHRQPGIRFEELPHIDAILLSHNHYDHLDKPTLRRLLKRDQPGIFCPMGVAKLLRRIGYAQVYELDWDGRQTWRGFEMHCVQAQHFSARTPFDRDHTLWCGWVLRRSGATEGAIYFAADTGFGDHFSAIAEAFPDIRLSLLPIGAYRPEWFMGPVHMSPAEAFKAHRVLRSQASVAIHFGTFSLADDGETEAGDRLREVVAENPDAHPFLVMEEGMGRDFEVYKSAV